MSLTEIRTRPQAILDYIAARGALDSVSLVTAFDWEPGYVSGAVRHLWQSGKLVRERIPSTGGRRYNYRLRQLGEPKQHEIDLRVHGPANNVESPPQSVEQVAGRLRRLQEMVRCALAGSYDPYTCQVAAIEACGVASRVFQHEGGSERKAALETLSEALWALGRKDTRQRREAVTSALALLDPSAARREGERP